MNENQEDQVFWHVNLKGTALGFPARSNTGVLASDETSAIEKVKTTPEWRNLDDPEIVGIEECPPGPTTELLVSMYVHRDLDRLKGEFSSWGSVDSVQRAEINMPELVSACPDCKRRGHIEGVECCRCAGTGHIGDLDEPWLTLHAENCSACETSLENSGGQCV